MTIFMKQRSCGIIQNMFAVILVFGCMVLHGCSDTKNRPEETGDMEMKKQFTYSNPIAYGDKVDSGRGLRDPFILKDGDFWYMTGTRKAKGRSAV